MSSSHYEGDIQNILKNWGIETEHTRNVLYPYEIDLYNAEHKIGIEFNGSFWHCEINKKRTYHQEKSKLADENGIFIYHIFEYEWLDDKKQPIILSQLRNLFGLNTTKIYARNCEIIRLDSKDCNLFLNSNHLQGADKAEYRLGLICNNELVSVMTFCQSRFNKRYDWELSRFCNKLGYTVVGGASKLFKVFKENLIGTMISYSNIAKTKGNLYQKLGFTLSNISAPNYVWYNDCSKEIKSRYECQMKNEAQIMHDQGFYRIYDCGNKVWILK
jgi:hypothetical protein